ncbi:MAG: low molecular weight phosphotyrosine protein phosphatase [Chloroflexota bacterium]
MANILIVCTANICRSPVAAALLRDRLARRGLTNWQVLSAGTWAMVARGASRNSIEVARRAGLDITQHRSMMVDERLLNGADLVLVMEIGHAEALRAEFPHQAHKVRLLAEMVGQTYSIADPYGGPLEEYERMVDGLTEVIEDGLERIIVLAKENANGRG